MPLYWSVFPSDVFYVYSFCHYINGLVGVQRLAEVNNHIVFSNECGVGLLPPQPRSYSVKLLCIAFKGYHILVYLLFCPYKVLSLLVAMPRNFYVVDIVVMH